MLTAEKKRKENWLKIQAYYFLLPAPPITPILGVYGA